MMSNDGLVAFVAPIVHGIDLVEIARIQKLLDDHGDRFLDRVFTAQERAYADAGGVRRVERLAARFAAKEALLKAIGTGLRSGMSWTDIEVCTLPSGEPFIAATGRVAEVASMRGISRWLLSLSHTGGLAMASVIGVSDSPPK